MTIDDRVRDALHDYADPIEPAPGSWERIASRFDDTVTTTDAGRRRGPSRLTGVFAVAALALVVVLITTMVVRDDGDGSLVTTTGAAGMPARILAVTIEGQPVLLDSLTGEQVAEFDYRGMAAGTQVAVTPDGSAAYVVHGDGNQGCADHKIVRIPLDGGGDAQTIESATSPTVSPDGRSLAYLLCMPGDARPDVIVLRDLATGATSPTRAPPGTSYAGLLRFDGDSRHVTFDLSTEGTSTYSNHSIDLVGGELPPGRQVPILDPNIPLQVPPSLIASDRPGRHFLAVASDILYRWSSGDDEPTELAEGIIAAGWVPDRAPEPAPAPDPTSGLPNGIAMVRNDVLVVYGVQDRAQHSSLGPVAPGTALSATADGRTWVLGPSERPTSCNFDDPEPSGIDVLDTKSRDDERIVNYAYSPAVSSRGLVAYGYACDGDGLGFTNIETGENSRVDTLLGRNRGTRIPGVWPVSWSPDGTRLLYWVQLQGETQQRLFVGEVRPATAELTQVIEVPGAHEIQAATFSANDGLVIALWRAGRSEVIDLELDFLEASAPRRGDALLEGSALLTTGEGRFSFPSSIVGLSADPSGDHLLVVLDGGSLHRWKPGELTKVTDGVSSAVFLPWS
jgi:hypothetical protein